MRDKRIASDEAFVNRPLTELESELEDYMLEFVQHLAPYRLSERSALGQALLDETKFFLSKFRVRPSSRDRQELAVFAE